jgi:ABC-type transport system involved in cytochrome c biogenesis permease subunit
VSGAQPRWLVPLAIGTVIFLPAALTLPWFSIMAVAWLGLVGLAVPAAVIERRGPLDALRRGYRLGRADYVHAVGGIAALVIVYSLTGPLLALLLRSQADNAARLAIFLADVVVSPILFLGSALLYYDQAARSRIERRVPRG